MVRRDVLEATKGQQVPWDNSSLTGEVILKQLEMVEPLNRRNQRSTRRSSWLTGIRSSPANPLPILKPT